VNFCIYQRFPPKDLEKILLKLGFPPKDLEKILLKLGFPPKDLEKILLKLGFPPKDLEKILLKLGFPPKDFYSKIRYEMRMRMCKLLPQGREQISRKIV